MYIYVKFHVTLLNSILTHFISLVSPEKYKWEDVCMDTKRLTLRSHLLWSWVAWWVQILMGEAYRLETLQRGAVWAQRQSAGKSGRASVADEVQKQFAKFPLDWERSAFYSRKTFNWLVKIHPPYGEESVLPSLMIEM